MTSLIIGQAARALTRAHAAGIIHRDLKPDNIFRRPRNDEAEGARLRRREAKDRGSGGQRTGRGSIGTPHYMSPEQIEGARYVDHKADLWSLAVIAFECITGVRPVQGRGTSLALVLDLRAARRPVPSALCSVPAGFDAWFAKATHRDSTMRFRFGRRAGRRAASRRANRKARAGSSRNRSSSAATHSPARADSKLESGLVLGVPASSELDYVNVRHLDSEQCLVWYRNVQMVLSLQAPSYTFMRRIMEGLKELAAACGTGVGALVVVRSGARPPSEEARDYMARELAQTTMIAAAQVVEGEGFLGAAMRSVLSLLQLAARPRYPMKVFGDLTPASVWLAAELQKSTAERAEGGGAGARGQ